MQVGENVFYIKFTSKYQEKETLKFIVKRRDIYTVTFNPDDGSNVTTIEVEEDSYIIQIPQMSKAGYDFGGWGYDFTQPITETLNLTPVWNAIFTVQANTITGLTEYGNNIKHLDLPTTIDGVNITNIGAEAFINSIFTKIEIPATITQFGNSVFANSKVFAVFYKGTVDQWLNIDFANITSNPLVNQGFLDINMNIIYEVKIKNTFKEIKPFVFAKCSGITKLTFEENSILTSIGEGAFVGSSLQVVENLPNSVTSIGKSAFATITLYGISFEENSQLKAIGDRAFEDTSIGNILIPQSVETIGKRAFANCRELVRVVFEENANIKTVEEAAFDFCENLAEVEFGVNSKLETIGKYVFNYCVSLHTLIIPKTLIKVGEYSFDGCRTVIHIHYGGTQEDWNKIMFENVSANPLCTGGTLYTTDTDEE